MREVFVEETDERPDGAGGVVVLRLAQQERAAALEVAEVDVVAERGADDAAGVAHGEHDFRLRVVPLRLRVDADLGAGADGGHRLPLGKYFRVWADPDFEILGPYALGDQDVLEPPCLIGPGAYLLQVGADDRRDRRAQALGLCRVSAGLLFDDPLEQARDERDTAGFDRLEVAGREEPGSIGAPGFRCRVREYVSERRNPRQRTRAANRPDRIVEVQELARRGRHAGEIVESAILNANERWARERDVRPPDAAYQFSLLVVFRETLPGAQPILHRFGHPFRWCSRVFLPAASTLTIASTSKTEPPHVPPLTS